MCPGCVPGCVPVCDCARLDVNLEGLGGNIVITASAEEISVRGGLYLGG